MITSSIRFNGYIRPPQDFQSPRFRKSIKRYPVKKDRKRRFFKPTAMKARHTTVFMSRDNSKL